MKIVVGISEVEADSLVVRTGSSLAITKRGNRAFLTLPSGGGGGGGGGGPWSTSGYTGTASRFAIFNASGDAAYLSYPSAGMVAWDGAGAGFEHVTVDAPLSYTGGHLSINLSAYLTTAAAATAYQPLNTNLTALGGLGDGLPYHGGGVWGSAALGDLALSGGSVEVSQARGLRESGGTTLAMDTVANGSVLRRVGSTIVGAAIGAVLQAYSDILNAISALTDVGLIVRTGGGTVAARTLAQGPGITITNADGASGNPTIAMSGGSNTDTSALAGYRNSWSPDATAMVSDNSQLVQTGTKNLGNDGSGRRLLGLTGSPNYIYTSGNGSYVVGSKPCTASIIIHTNTTALTNEVYKFGLVGSNSFTTALADVIQTIALVYRYGSNPGFWYVVTSTATSATSTLTAIPVAANTKYKITLTTSVGTCTFEVFTLSGSTWVSAGSVTVASATMPGSGSKLGLAFYSAVTAGSNECFIYGADLLVSFAWS